MSLRFSDIVDVSKIQTLHDSIYEAFGIPTAILNPDGTVLIASGWKKICTDFHRKHPETAARCRESDTALSGPLPEDRKFKIYECLNGMVDVAMPIHVEGEHIATLFTGQFFFDPPDIDFFRHQAEQFGFDEPAYLEAVREVPVVSREAVDRHMSYLANQAMLFVELGLKEKRYRELVDNANSIILRWKPDGCITFFNEFAQKFFGYDASEIIGRNIVGTIVPETETTGRNLRAMVRDVVKAPEKYQNNENENVCKNGRRVWVSWTNRSLFSDDGSLREILSVGNDRTARRHMEKELDSTNTQLQLAQKITMTGGWQFDVTTRQVSWTDQTYHIHEVPLHQPVPLDRALGFYHPEDRPKLQEAFNKAVTEGVPYDLELRFKTAKGRNLWVHTICEPVFENQKVVRLYGSFQDITQRKTAREHIEKQKYYLEKSQELGQIGTWELDLIENHLVWTDENCRIFGVPEGSVVDYEIFLSKVHPEDRAYVDREWKLALAGRSYDIEHRVLIDGKVKWVREKADIEFDKNGSPVRAIGFTQDITERKQYLDALIEKDQFLEAIYRGISHSIFVVDVAEDGEFRYAGLNPTHEALTGISDAAIKGKRPGEIMPEDAARRVCKHYTDCVRTRQPLSYEEWLPFKGEQTCWETFLHPQQDPSGRIYKIIGTSREITDRKRAELALRKSEEKLRAILDSLPEMVMQVDPDMTMSWANKAALEMNPEAVGKKCYQAFPRTEERTVCDGCPVERCLKSGDIESGEIFHESLEGIDGCSWWATMGIPLKDSDGSVVGAIEFARNITESKKNEENLRQAQKMESIGTLAGGIAHEFNNILGGIFGYVETAKEDAPDTGTVRESLDEISKLGMRARDVVRQILAFSRKDRQAKKPVRLHSIIQEEIKVLRATIPTTVDIRQNIDDRGDTILADAGQIQQVVMNLCLNAAHAMGEKGGVLELALSSAVVDMEEMKLYPGLSPGEHVRLTVSDTGTGIDPEIIGKIFDPFFTTKPAEKGTGMGLSVVYGIVKDHSGAISVSSRPGQGTVFTVLFPKTDAAVPVGAKDKIMPTGTEHILIVDDEDFMVFPQKRSLERLGYRVTAMTSSLGALDLFRKDPHAYDLMITDLTMPDMTGDRLAEAVTAIRPDLPVILTTGYADAVDDEKIKQSGIRAFLSKPCKKEDLAVTIRRVLDKP